MCALVLFPRCCCSSLVTIVYIGLCRAKEGLSDDDLARQLAKYDNDATTAGPEEPSTVPITNTGSLEEPLLDAVNDV